MNKTERVRLYHQKIASSLLDKRQRQRDEEKLDDYGVAMSFDPVKTPEEAMIEREECEAIAKAMLRLPARREYVVRAHYGINVEPQTLKEIGETFGITNSAIQVIEYKALRSLSHPKSGLLRKLRPEKYARERARLDARIKQSIEYEKARVEREMQEARERQADRWHERQAEMIDAAASAARWARAKERLARQEAESKVVEFERRRRELRDLFLEAYEEASYINSLWGKELLRREIAVEQARELEAKRQGEPKRRDWLWVASDRKQA